MTPRPLLFLDTSALFSAIWSESGGARLLLRLGEAEAVDLVAGTQVLAELDATLRAKKPEALLLFARLLDRCRLAVAPVPPAETVRLCLAFGLHPGDARVLAEAWSAGVDFFVTHNQHFSANPAARQAVPFPIGTPGDCLAWLRARWELPTP
jgi:predicted nucleic acid-binding protein